MIFVPARTLENLTFYTKIPAEITGKEFSVTGKSTYKTGIRDELREF